MWTKPEKRRRGSCSRTPQWWRKEGTVWGLTLTPRQRLCTSPPPKATSKSWSENQCEHTWATRACWLLSCVGVKLLFIKSCVLLVASTVLGQSAVTAGGGCGQQRHRRVVAAACSSSLGAGGGVHPALGPHVRHGCCQQCGESKTTFRCH